LAGEEITSVISLFVPIVPIITALIALVGAKFVVSDWQTRKDKSEIKKEVIRNFNHFKNRVIMMDTFVAELISEYVKFDNSLTTKEYRAQIVNPVEHRLSKLLPWHSSYEDLERYSDKMDWKDLKNLDNQEITPVMIKQRIKALSELTECYIEFREPPLEKFKPQFTMFKKKFNNYSADLEFKTLADLYYYVPASRVLSLKFLKKKNERQVFLENFNGMWEYMNACYILVNTIMYTTNEDDFLKKIDEYTKCEVYLFYFIEWFETKLIRGKIKI
jgi:hypothetical protein